MRERERGHSTQQSRKRLKMGTVMTPGLSLIVTQSKKERDERQEIQNLIQFSIATHRPKGGQTERPLCAALILKPLDCIAEDEGRNKLRSRKRKGNI